MKGCVSHAEEDTTRIEGNSSSSPAPSHGQLPRWRWLGNRKDRDPITAYRTEPEFFAHLNGDGSNAEPIDIGITNEFLEFQRGRIDFHDIRCLRRRGPSLTGSQ